MSSLILTIGWGASALWAGAPGAEWVARLASAEPGALRATDGYWSIIEVNHLVSSVFVRAFAAPIMALSVSTFDLGSETWDALGLSDSAPAVSSIWSSFTSISSLIREP